MHHSEYFRGLFMVTHALMFHLHCLISLQCFFVSVLVLSHQSLRHVQALDLCSVKEGVIFTSVPFVSYSRLLKWISYRPQ